MKTNTTNEFEIFRRIGDRVVRVYANYNEPTDDWIVMCFIDDQGKVIDMHVCATTDVLGTAADMIKLALASK